MKNTTNFYPQTHLPLRMQCNLLTNSKFLDLSFHWENSLWVKKRKLFMRFTVHEKRNVIHAIYCTWKAKCYSCDLLYMKSEMLFMQLTVNESVIPHHEWEGMEVKTRKWLCRNIKFQLLLANFCNLISCKVQIKEIMKIL